MNADVDLAKLAVDRDMRHEAKSRIGPRKHLLTRYLFPGLLLAGALGLLGWSAFDRLFPPCRVSVVPVAAFQTLDRQEGTPLFQAAGWIEPRPTPVRVAALASGVIDQLLVVEDQEVNVGMPIAGMIKDDANLELQRAEADIELRNAELEAARATLVAATLRFDQPVHLRATVGEAEAALAGVETELVNLPFEIRRAEAQLAYAKKNYEGKHSAAGAIAGRVVDEARSAYTVAQSHVDELHHRVESLNQQKLAIKGRRDALETQLELRTDERRAKQEAAASVKVASARLQLANVAMAEAMLQRDRMTIRSPIEGRVLHVIANPGSRLSVGRGRNDSSDGSTVVTLYRPDMLQVRVDVRFEDLPKVHVGQKVSLSSAAVSASWEGRVLFVSSEADIQKNTLEVKVVYERTLPVIKPEMLVEVTFLATKSSADRDTPTEELHLFVPKELVQQAETGAFVWVADQSAGVARHTSVKIAETRPDGLVRITYGLNPTSRIISQCDKVLRDGMRIQVTGGSR